jgi:hypothetical protein
MVLHKSIARQLFVNHYLDHTSDEDTILDDILAAVGYNTLVIELL